MAPNLQTMLARARTMVRLHWHVAFYPHTAPPALLAVEYAGFDRDSTLSMSQKRPVARWDPLSGSGS
jgi:hypothetical protein